MFLRNLLSVACCGLLLLSVAGCASVRPEPPEVNLVNVRIGDLTLSHANLLADLRVYNPNPVPILLEKVSYDFLLDGIKVASGRSVSPIEIGSSEYGEITLRLSTGYLDLLRYTRGRSPGEAIGYAIDGALEVGGWRVLDATIPFRSEGEIPLDLLPVR